MNAISTTINFKEDINFNFNISYLGSEITLQIASNNGVYCVSHNQKPIGNIKLGGISNTWYAIDKSYTPIYLMDAIANKIAAQL